MSPLDRFWSSVSRLAAARVSKREAVFKGGAVHRLTNDWMTGLRSADEEVKRDQRLLRARARDLARNNAYAKQFLRLLKVNVIGPVGFKHQAQVRNNDGRLAKPINDRIEAAWAEWSKAASLDGRLSLVDLQRQALVSKARDGEALLRKWRGLDVNRFGFALEPIDVDLLDHEMNQAAGKGSANEIRMGVEIDQRSRRVAYHVFEGKYDYLRTTRRIRIPADDILHLYDPERANQTRGVTWFHAVMLAMHVLNAYIDAGLYASRIGASTMGIWVKKPELGMGGTEPKGGDRPEIIEANPGTFGFAPEGYEMQQFSANHPSPEVDPFVKCIEREIATGLGITRATLAGDLEATSYSSMKVGKNDERALWRSLQQAEDAQFITPVYADWMTEARMVDEATGGAIGLALDMRDPRRFLEARWAPPGWPSPDPVKDMKAIEIALAHGLTAPQLVVEEAGQHDLEVIYDLLEQAKEMAAERGLDFSTPPAAGADAQDAEEKDDEDEKDEAEATEKKNGAGRNGANRVASLMRGSR